jgi:phage gp36-like protein
MYSDKDYFLERISLTDLNKLTNTSDSNLTAAIEAADSLIDSYLRNKINTLPLTSPPEVIRQCSYNIAIYNLHDRPQFSRIPEWVQTKYADAISYLKDVSTGKVNLNVTVPDEQKETSIQVDGNELRMMRNFP